MASEPCALECGYPVNPHDQGTWKEVAGFVGGPKKDHMKLRKETGRVAHQHCVQNLQQGQAADQVPMFSEQDSEPIADKVFPYVPNSSTHIVLTEDEEGLLS